MELVLSARSRWCDGGNDMGDFLKDLDKMLGIEAPKQLIETQTQTPQYQEAFEERTEPEFEDAKSTEPKEPDAFRDMLDSALSSEGVDVELEMRRKYNPMNGDLAVHEWEMQREVLYSGEKYKFRCKRCLKWVSVGGDQTMNQALVEQGVDPVCGTNIIKDIQDEV